MNKPGRFRTALLAALPDVAQDPQRLSIYVERGHLVATGAPGSGWQYSYQLSAVLQDFAGDMDDLALAVMQWVEVEQPDLLKNDTANKRGVRFECDLISNELADVAIEIDLTEAVYPSVDGTQFVHPAEPPADPTAAWLWPTT